MKGHHASELRITPQNLEEVACGSDQPDIMRAIFKLAWEVALNRCLPEYLIEYCSSQHHILWQPEDLSTRHINIRLAHSFKESTTHVHRVVWIATRDLNRPLHGNEEILTACGLNGNPSTGRGCCLNPAHLLRGTAKHRLQLKTARGTLRALGFNPTLKEMPRAIA